jgi:hypothetical protein
MPGPAGEVQGAQYAMFPSLKLASMRPPMSAPLSNAIAEYLTAFCFVTGHEPLVAQAKRRQSAKV